MRLCGINPVAERLQANPRSVRKVFLHRQTSVSKIFHLCRETGVPVETLSEDHFRRLSAGMRAQGVVAEVDGFAYADYDDLLGGEASPQPTLVFLDGLNDPHNLGAILRTLACLGGFAVVLPKHDSVEVTDAVLRVASGGENYVPIAKVTNLSQALRTAKEYRYWIAATVVEGGEALSQRELPLPLGIVCGSEGRGVRPGLLKHADLQVTVPMSGADLSLNVAVACALVCYEVVRQKGSRQQPADSIQENK